MLKFAFALNATLCFPRPCAGLTSLHSKEFADCKHGWNRYLSIDQFFYGYHDSIYPPNCTTTVELTRSYLTGLRVLPPGDDVCFTLRIPIRHINIVIEEATRRLLHLLQRFLSDPTLHSVSLRISYWLSIIYSHNNTMQLRFVDWIIINSLIVPRLLQLWPKCPVCMRSSLQRLARILGLSSDMSKRDIGKIFDNLWRGISSRLFLVV